MGRARMGCNRKATAKLVWVCRRRVGARFAHRLPRRSLARLPPCSADLAPHHIVS